MISPLERCKSRICGRAGIHGNTGWAEFCQWFQCCLTIAATVSTAVVVALSDGTPASIMAKLTPNGLPSMQAVDPRILAFLLPIVVAAIGLFCIPAAIVMLLAACARPVPAWPGDPHRVQRHRLSLENQLERNL